LKKVEKRGKLSVGICDVDKFSTYGANVEKPYENVENLRIVYEKTFPHVDEL